MPSLLAIPFPAVDPVAFEVGPIVVRWYALAYVAGLLFAVWYARRLVATPALWVGGKPTLEPHEVDDLLLWATVGVVVGGRLGYVLVYDPLHFLAHPLDILKVWTGGMSFHGGFLGVVVAFLLFGRRHGVGLDRLLDLAAAGAPVGLMLGRLANFVNGELWGRPSELPWAVVFPAGGEVGRHPSQLYEAGLEGLLLFLVLRIATHRFHALARPGLVSAIFALGYGSARIAAEFFREPDAQIGFLAGGLTMGMLLSLPLLGIGVWLALRASRPS
jgi:phosphatidylglycerol:prolipoprotein diacylglycerol transferase